MGIFNAKPSKKQEGKTLIYNKLYDSELVNHIMHDISVINTAVVKEENFEWNWIFSALGYYDKRRRAILIYERGVVFIKLNSYGISDSIKSEIMETIKKREGLIFEYTDYGFTPLPSFSNQEFALSKKEIMQLLSMVLTVKLNEIYNYLKFLEPIELTLDAGDVTEAVIVQYEVPKLTWKAWF